MAQGFRGNAAKKYFATISTALERASMLSGTPASQLPDGETGGYQLEIGNSSNIVIIDEVYHHGISMMTDADIETEGKLRYVISRLEDVCHTLFKIPATTAKIEELLGELKAHMNGYRDHSIEARRITQGYMIQMSFYDQGETRVYNDYSIREYIRTCSIEVSRQINSLNNKKNELTADLYSSQYALSEARSLLDRLLAEQATGGLTNPTQLSSVNSGISGLSDKITSLSTQIREIEECIDYLRTTLHKANSTIEDLLENVQSVDRSYTLDIEALNDWTQQYINRMREIGDSIGGVMHSAVTGERIGMLSCPVTLDTLLEALAIFNEKDRTAILEIVADAPKPYRCMIFALADKINIATLEAVIEYEENGIKKERNGAWFAPSDGRIHLNMSIENDNYFVFFHEIGHMIDFYATTEWLNHDSNVYFTSGMSSFSQVLYDTLKSDVELHLRKVASEIAPNIFLFSDSTKDLSITEINEIIDITISNIMAGNKVENEETDAERLQVEIYNSIRRELNGDEMISVSNLFGGITNNAVHGGFGHFIDNYWFRLDGQPTGAHQQEFWANFYSNQMRRCDESLKNEEQYLGGAIMVLYNVVNDMESLRRGR